MCSWATLGQNSSSTTSTLFPITCSPETSSSDWLACTSGLTPCWLLREKRKRETTSFITFSCCIPSLSCLDSASWILGQSDFSEDEIHSCPSSINASWIYMAAGSTAAGRIQFLLTKSYSLHVEWEIVIAFVKEASVLREESLFHYSEQVSMRNSIDKTSITKVPGMQG